MTSALRYTDVISWGGKSPLHGFTLHLMPLRHLPPPLHHLTAAFSFLLSISSPGPAVTFLPLHLPPPPSSILPLPLPSQRPGLSGCQSGLPTAAITIPPPTHPDISWHTRGQRAQAPHSFLQLLHLFILPFLPFLPSVLLFLPVNLCVPTCDLAQTSLMFVIFYSLYH